MTWTATLTLELQGLDEDIDQASDPFVDVARQFEGAYLDPNVRWIVDVRDPAGNHAVVDLDTETVIELNGKKPPVLPAGCTGALHPDGTITHDGPTCPVHEEVSA